LIRFAKSVEVDLDQSMTGSGREPVTASQIASTAPSFVPSIERLARHPMMARPGWRAGTRELVITRYSYFVVYEVEAGDVTVADVIHTRQQWPSTKGEYG